MHFFVFNYKFFLKQINELIENFLMMFQKMFQKIAFLLKEKKNVSICLARFIRWFDINYTDKTIYYRSYLIYQNEIFMDMLIHAHIYTYIFTLHTYSIPAQNNVHRCKK